jgi:hypothetical protein
MKKLIYIPIVHNKADLGSLGSQLSVEGERKYGASAWHHHLEQVDIAWDKISAEISKKLKKTSAERIKIYQDGLPVADDIGRKIVRDAAASGSKNYLIVEGLLDRGAKLELAENKDLLLQEYYLLLEINKAETPEKQLEAYMNYQQMSAELLNSRDRFVADQINATLNEGDVGVAFFGGSHSITDKLNKDIKVMVIQLFRDEVSLNLINTR